MVLLVPRLTVTLTALQVCAAFYLCTSAEAPGVQEREDVQRQCSGQLSGEVQGLDGHPLLQLLDTEFLLRQGAALEQVHQDPPPLVVCPLVKLKEGVSGCAKEGGKA